jgi:hypothetical protein
VHPLERACATLRLLRTSWLQQVGDEVLLINEDHDLVSYIGELAPSDHLRVDIAVRAGATHMTFDRLVADPTALTAFIAAHFGGWWVVWDTSGVAGGANPDVRPANSTSAQPAVAATQLLNRNGEAKSCGRAAPQTSGLDHRPSPPPEKDSPVCDLLARLQSRSG